MAADIVAILGEGQDSEPIAKVLEQSLWASNCPEGVGWMEEYLGRPRRNTWPPVVEEDPYFKTVAIIGRDNPGGPVVLKRVEDYNSERNFWQTLVMECENGEERRIRHRTADTQGLGRGDPFFCWDRPYRYFEEWMHCSRASGDRDVFVDRFHRVVDSKRRIYPDDYDDDEYENCAGLLPCIDYGAISRAYGSFQWDFEGARTQATNTAAAIAAGAQGKDLWSALALDFNAWMAMRPDMWPTDPKSSASSVSIIDCEQATHSILHTIPPEVIVQILPLVPVSDLRSLLQLSRSVHGLVEPLLDEVLWHHVHYGDLRWILPVPGVKGEVERANDTVKGWYSNPARLPSIFDSREFPFARFIIECAGSCSMRNRRRLWKIYKQYKVLWEAMGFDT
ncbi:hypothetical protein DFH06DRAFT_1482271 [Mycena polygramma]|nr:hypothetical protein DFH06DRAFT_1482271 [Mycena polygramma]